MNAEHLAYGDNSFDIVFCHALLHHVDDIDKIICEMKRVSRNDVVVLEPNRNNPLMFMFSAFVKEERKALCFTIQFMQDFMVENGLTVEKHFSHGMIVPNKTPEILLPVLRIFNFRHSLGMTNFMISSVR